MTIVVTDIDDELPVFSRSESSVPVPEDVGKYISVPRQSGGTGSGVGSS